MTHFLKTIARDLLPAKYQVPAKYWFNSFRGGLEEEMKFLSLLVKKHDRVIDVGGNRGIYAYNLWRLGATVEVFEPNPTCLNVLTAWAKDKPSVHLHPVALSNHAGSANLHIPVDQLGVEHDASASIEHTGFGQSRDQLVPLRALDSFNFQGVSLIKIDVEGHEYSVIEGATATIEASQPAMLVEIEQRHSTRPIDEIFTKVLELGYQGFFVDMGRITGLEKFNLADHQSMANFNGAKGPYINNFLFLHRDRIKNGEYGAVADGLMLQ
jgi:FkbM family methyltransferase